MSKRRSIADGDGERLEAPQRDALRPWLKAVISILLALHVTAVFVAPFAFASNSGPQPSPFADALFGLLRPYISALFLDHGYFFFAPNPGPSHLVDYKVEFDDGRPPVSGRFPNRATQRPRLLYHRHLMVSEALSGRFVPPQPPPEPSSPPLTADDQQRARYQLLKEEHLRQVENWRRSRRVYEAMRQSIEEHLKFKYGGTRVTITRVQHLLPMADEVDRLGRKLDAPDSYINLSETAGYGSRQ